MKVVEEHLLFVYLQDEHFYIHLIFFLIHLYYMETQMTFFYSHKVLWLIIPYDTKIYYKIKNWLVFQQTRLAYYWQRYTILIQLHTLSLVIVKLLTFAYP